MSFYSYIFSSLVTLLKATASIYPEWMNEPTDETRRGKKWRPHSLKWLQPISLSFSNMFSNSVFYMQSNTAWWFQSFWHNVFYSSVSEETVSCLPASQWQEDGCWGFQLGGRDVTVSGVMEQRKLETRQKCVYSCQLVSWPSSGLPFPSVGRGN